MSDLAQLALLLGGALIAGWIDAVIGGGGLIMVPLLLATLPQAPPVMALATNKVVGISGTTSAAITLGRRVGLDRRILFVGVPLAFLAAAGGAYVAGSLPPQFLRPIVIAGLLLAGSAVAFKPSFGTHSARVHARPLLALLTCLPVCFYDGLFGPGTGLFLLLALTWTLNGTFLAHTAAVKALNAATNFGALAWFLYAGHVMWALAIPLAIANIVGAQLGARTVIKGGNRLLRLAILVLVCVEVVYLLYQQLV